MDEYGKEFIMSKKVLILSGSPRRGGNSDTLCDEFMRGAEDTGNTVVKVFLGDYKINYCTGCGVCNGTHQCVQKDVYASILLFHGCTDEDVDRPDSTALRRNTG